MSINVFELGLFFEVGKLALFVFKRQSWLSLIIILFVVCGVVLL